MKIDESCDKLFPSVLCGRARDARRKWRSITRQAVKDLSWDKALAKTDWVPIDQTPGQFEREGANPLLQGDNTYLYPIIIELSAALYDCEPEQRFEIRKQLVLEAVQSFWFCLGIIARGLWLPLAKQPDDERRAFVREVLRAVLKWWPQICELDDRFFCIMYDGAISPGYRWSDWGHCIRVTFYQELGVTGEKIDALAEIDPITAGETMSQWVEQDL